MNGLVVVVFEYGRTWDRSPLKGLAVVAGSRTYKGREYWHIKPVWWSQGSPLSKWVEPGDVTVLNAEAPVLAEAS